MRRERVRELLILTALACTVTLFFLDILLAGLNLYIRDVARTYYPERRVIAEVLKRGEFPFWNPYVNGGQPMAANPAYEVFYPLQWLLPLGSFRDAFHAVIVLHYPLAAIGMFLLLRALGVRRLVASFGGFSYALGGPMLSMGSLIPFLYAMAWLPWVGWLFRRAVHRRTISSVAPAGLALGVILLIGEASMILQSGALVAMYALFAARKQRSSRPLAMAAATIAIATLIGAVQILAALEHQRESGRSRPLSFATATQWSMPPYRPVEMVWPTLFGAASPDVAFQWGLIYLYPKEAWPWVMNLYPGILAAVLIIAGFAARVRGALFVAATAIIGYLLAIGRFGFLFPLLYRLGLQSLRYPEKFILTAMFVLAVFAGIVAEEAIRDAAVRRTTMIVAAILTSITVIIVMLTMLPAYPRWFAQVWSLRAIDLDLAARFRGGMLLTLALAAMVTIVLATERISPHLRLLLLGLIVVVDLGSRVEGWLPRITADYYDRPPIARMLARRGYVRIYSAAEWETLHAKPRPLPAGILPWITRNGLFSAWETTFGFDGAVDTDVTTTNLLPSIDFAATFHLAESLRPDRLPLLSQMAGISHIGELQPLDPGIVEDPRRFDEIQPARFFEMRNDGPYYFATRLIDGDMKQALLSDASIPVETAFVSMKPFTPATGQVLAAARTSNTIALDVAAAGRAFLVLAVTPHKYWTATIDGRPAQLHLANIGFQGLIVDAGRHHIEMRYRNTLVIACAWVSAIAALLTIAVSLAAALRSTVPPPHRQH